MGEKIFIRYFLSDKVVVALQSLCCVWLFATPWTAAYQAPPSMGFSRQEYWSGVPLPSPSGETTKGKGSESDLGFWWQVTRKNEKHSSGSIYILWMGLFQDSNYCQAAKSKILKRISWKGSSVKYIRKQWKTRMCQQHTFSLPVEVKYWEVSIQ